jgi:hypothetical protein
MKLIAILVVTMLTLSATAVLAQQGRFVLFCAFAGYCQEAELRQPGQGCPEGWMATGNYCVPGSDKAPAAIPQERLVSGWLARERQLLHPLSGSKLHPDITRTVK